ncbi:MAG: TrmH family RNA methyltransferase [Mycobacteriales bacterium]
MDLQPVGIHHPRVKHLLALQANQTPNRHQRFIAEGLWAHEVLLDAGTEIDTFLLCPDALRSDVARTIVAPLTARARHSYEISRRTLERLSERDAPDGLLSIADMPQWDPDRLDLSEPALALVADAVEIPGNLGTLIRTMDGCAADVLVLTNRRTRMTHPKVFRGSHGMSVRVPYVDFEQPDDAARWLQDRGFALYLADANGATAYRSVPYAARSALVVGNERYGISAPWYAHGAMPVTIPMLGQADSLNVSISASVLMYEIRARQSGW